MTEIHATGMSYGAKAFAQVISDMYKTDIETMSEEEKTKLLNNIKLFVNVTLENSVENLAKAIQNTKTAFRKLQDVGIITDTDTTKTEKNNINTEKE